MFRLGSQITTVRATHSISNKSCALASQLLDSCHQIERRQDEAADLIFEVVKQLPAQASKIEDILLAARGKIMVSRMISQKIREKAADLAKS